MSGSIRYLLLVHPEIFLYHYMSIVVVGPLGADLCSYAYGIDRVGTTIHFFLDRVSLISIAGIRVMYGVHSLSM